MKTIIDVFLADTPETLQKIIPSDPDNADSMMLLQYAIVVTAVWESMQHIPDAAEYAGALVQAYAHGYRKGRASVPLTLVVADEGED